MKNKLPFSYIKSDLYRYSSNGNIYSFLKTILINRGFRLIFYYRLINSIPFNVLKKILSFFYKLKCNKFCIDLPLKTRIGYGLYIGHTFSIAISKLSIIGNNVNISQGVTIGSKLVKGKKVAPHIGNRVYIGPNVTIIGDITVGDNVIIGANSVVTKDIPEGSVFAGVPAREIGKLTQNEYINNIFI